MKELKQLEKRVEAATAKRIKATEQFEKVKETLQNARNEEREAVIRLRDERRKLTGAKKPGRKPGKAEAVTA